MESSDDPTRQLAEIERLQTATTAESLLGRRWAIPVLALAIIGFFGSYALDSKLQRVVAPIVWTAFVVVWVVWMRSGNRARASWRAGYQWRRDLPLWLALLVASYLIVILVAQVSSLLVGVLLAALATGSGLVARWRTQR